jgi:predicted S18 family serine protease
MGFVSQLEINFLLVEKHQFDQFSNLSYQMLRSRDRDDGTQRLSEKKQVLKSLQATYDQLRYFKDGVSQFLPPTKDRHFGPVIFDTNVQVN